MSSNLPLGCENDPSAPFNEVEYIVSFSITKYDTFTFDAKPGLSESDIIDIAADLIKGSILGEEYEIDNIKVQ